MPLYLTKIKNGVIVGMLNSLYGGSRFRLPLRPGCTSSHILFSQVSGYKVIPINTFQGTNRYDLISIQTFSRYKVVDSFYVIFRFDTIFEAKMSQI